MRQICHIQYKNTVYKEKLPKNEQLRNILRFGSNLMNLKDE